MWTPTQQIQEKFDALILFRQATDIREPGEDFRRAMTAAKETPLTAEAIRSLVTYNSETGEISWKPEAAVGRGCHKRVVGRKLKPTKKGGYLVMQIQGILYLCHRLAWLLHYGVWPTEDIDHIDRNPANNTIMNLREVSNRENHANRSDNSSGAVGVIWEKARGKWKAYTRIGYTMHNIGRFEDKEDAVSARKFYLERAKCLGF